MDLKTLQTFHRIVKTGSFHRAAEEMNYAQSTVTMQLQRLEAELGVQLLERGQKSVSLTEAGRLFYQQSVHVLKRMEQLQETMREIEHGQTGAVRIGVTEPSASRRLPALLRAFMETHPKVRVSVHIANTPVICEWLRAGEIDFAICTTPDIGSGLWFEPVFEEEFVVVVPAGDVLADKPSLSPADFEGRRLLITAQNCPYRKKLEVTAQGWGVTLETMEVSSITALPSYVEQGLGIALVPRILADASSSRTVVRELAGNSVSMPTGFLYEVGKLPMRPATQALYECLQEKFIGANA